MDEIVYNALTKYYSALCKLGYYKYESVYKLILLCFYRDFVFHDYRGLLSYTDYQVIEKALNCLFGTDCLIPYPDYLKMGKLDLGKMSELAQRVKTLEETDVVKVIDDLANITNVDSESDVMIVADED